MPRRTVVKRIPPHVADLPEQKRASLAESLKAGEEMANIALMDTLTTPLIATGLYTIYSLVVDRKAPGMELVKDMGLHLGVGAAAAFAADVIAPPVVDVMEARGTKGWGFNYKERSEGPQGFDDSPMERYAPRLIEPVAVPLGYALGRTLMSQQYSVASVRREAAESGLKSALFTSLGQLGKEVVLGRP